MIKAVIMVVFNVIESDQASSGLFVQVTTPECGLEADTQRISD